MRTLLTRALVPLAIACSLTGALPVAHAQDNVSFTGPGLLGGLYETTGIGGPVHSDARSLIVNAILFVLDFVTLAAVIVIIISGIRLIVSQGDDEAWKKTKAVLLYTAIGLLIILFSRILVTIFADALPLWILGYR